MTNLSIIMNYLNKIYIVPTKCIIFHSSQNSFLEECEITIRVIKKRVKNIISRKEERQANCHNRNTSTKVKNAHQMISNAHPTLRKTDTPKTRNWCIYVLWTRYSCDPITVSLLGRCFLTLEQ